MSTTNPNPSAGDAASGHGDHLQYLLSAYLFDNISDAGRKEVEEHLAACPECRAELAELRTTLERVVDALAPEELEGGARPAQYSFEARRLERVLHAARRERTLLGWVRRHRGLMALAAAAVVVIGVLPMFLGLAVRRKRASMPGVGVQNVTAAAAYREGNESVIANPFPSEKFAVDLNEEVKGTTASNGPPNIPGAVAVTAPAPEKSGAASLSFREQAGQRSESAPATALVHPAKVAGEDGVEATRDDRLLMTGGGNDRGDGSTVGGKPTTPTRGVTVLPAGSVASSERAAETSLYKVKQGVDLPGSGGRGGPGGGAGGVGASIQNSSVGLPLITAGSGERFGLSPTDPASRALAANSPAPGKPGTVYRESRLQELQSSGAGGRGGNREEGKVGEGMPAGTSIQNFADAPVVFPADSGSTDPFGISAMDSASRALAEAPPSQDYGGFGGGLGKDAGTKAWFVERKPADASGAVHASEARKSADNLDSFAGQASPSTADRKNLDLAQQGSPIAETRAKLPALAVPGAAPAPTAEPAQVSSEYSVSGVVMDSDGATPGLIPASPPKPAAQPERAGVVVTERQAAIPLTLGTTDQVQGRVTDFAWAAKPGPADVNGAKKELYDQLAKRGESEQSRDASKLDGEKAAREVALGRRSATGDRRSEEKRVAKDSERDELASKLKGQMGALLAGRADAQVADLDDAKKENKAGSEETVEQDFLFSTDLGERFRQTPANGQQPSVEGWSFGDQTLTESEDKTRGFGVITDNGRTGGQDLGFAKQGSPVRDVTLIMGQDRGAGRARNLLLLGGTGGGGGGVKLGENVESRLRSYHYYRALDPSLKPDVFFSQTLRVPAPAVGDEGLGEAGFRARYGVNPFVDTSRDHFSTFGMDVDTASFTLARAMIRSGKLPDPKTVRVEEFVNKFREDVSADPSTVFTVHCDGGPSPFGEGLDLLKITVKARELLPGERKNAVLTFTVDTSGSMNLEGRLALVRQSLETLVGSLQPEDRVGIVAFGASPYLVLPHTSARERERILGAVRSLTPGGGTNVEAGLDLAYRVADEVFDAKGVNRVVLCSDGVANVGARGPGEILRKAEVFAQRGVYLSCVGFGMGKYNDAMLETLSNKGNGNYAYVDSAQSATEVFQKNLPSTLQVLAQDAKVQVDFDPAVVSHYRLLGYENRDIADKDFRNDKVDAGEVGPGSTVTVLYEVRRKPSSSGDLGRVFIRYRDTGTGRVDEFNYPLPPGVLATSLKESSERFRFVACVAETAELLRGSYWARNGSFGKVLEVLGGLSPAYQARAEWQEVTDLAARAQELTIKDITSK